MKREGEGFLRVYSLLQTRADQDGLPIQRARGVRLDLDHHALADPDLKWDSPRNKVSCSCEFPTYCRVDECFVRGHYMLRHDSKRRKIAHFRRKPLILDLSVSVTG